MRLRAACLRRGLQQLIDVDFGGELKHLFSDLDHPAVKRASRDVHRLVEVVRGGGRVAVAPKDIHRLLSMEAVPRRKGKQLHQLTGLLQPPRLVGHRHAVDGGRKAAQQLDTDISGGSEHGP